jgi:DNA-binding transcriptional LysR family regulator
MQSFRWDDARVLLSLLETRTFSGAAAQLGVNTSTASRRLESLEESLGARLFDRTPDGVLPTALAEELRPYAESLSLSATKFAMAALGRDVEVAGEVKITAPPGIAENMLAPALPRLLKRFPKLQMIIDASVSYADLTRREADLALRVERPTHGDLVALKLGEGAETPFASRAYLKQLGTIKSPCDARWITWDSGLAHIPQARWVLELVPPSAIALRTNNINSQLNAASAGLGIVLTNRLYAKNKGLLPVKFAKRVVLPEPPRGSLWLVGHRALREVPKIAAVWEFIKEEAKRIDW